MSREYSIIELKELIAKAKTGEPEAFAVIYEQFYTPIFRYFYGRTGEKELAEDLTQDVFLKGYKNLSKYVISDSSPLTYFYTIARNSLIDYWRKGKTDHLEDSQLATISDPEIQTDKLSLGRETKEILQIGLSALNADQREVITLKYLNELSTKEVAELLGKSEDSIRQILVRGLRAMSEKLEKYEF